MKMKMLIVSSMLLLACREVGLAGSGGISTEAVYRETVCSDCQFDESSPVARLKRNVFVFFEPLKKMSNRKGSSLEAIGVVEQRKGAYGTGFLIGSCHMLTNFHAAFSGLVLDKMMNSKDYDPKDKAALSKTEVTFSVGQGGDSNWPFESIVKGKPVAWGLNYCASPACYRKFPQKEPKVKPPEMDRDEDWAIIELDQCVGDRYGYLTLVPVPGKILEELGFEKKFASTAGFPGRHDYKSIWVDDKCAIAGRNDIEGGQLHTCSNKPGSSGSPIFYLDKNGLSVVAINSGEASFNGEIPNPDEVITDFRGNLMNTATLVAGFIDKIKPFIGEQSKITWQQNRKKSGSSN